MMKYVMKVSQGQQAQTRHSIKHIHLSQHMVLLLQVNNVRVLFSRDDSLIFAARKQV